MAGDESFVVLVHHKRLIKRKTLSGVMFTNKDPLSIFLRPTTSYDDLVNYVLQKLGLQGVKRVKKFFYRISISVLQEIVKYDCFTIGSDEDLQVMFHCCRQFLEVRTPELLAKLVDVVSSSGGSNQNTPTVGTVADSSSRPVGASSSVPMYEPPVQPVASPSFAVDLNYSGGGEVGVGDFVPTSLQCAAPVALGDALLDDPNDDDVEPDIIADDSGNDIGASEPAGTGRGSSSGTQQYPSHFSPLDLDAMRQEGVLREPAEFGARNAEGSAGLIEFQMYSIRRGVQYKVVESDYRRADASVSIKVLLNATATNFGFRPTYRRVSLAKQKAVGHIYGNWNESYNELSRWVLGVQLMMPGTVAILRTSPVRVRGQPGLLVISDRHNGIKAALEAPDGGWLPPAAYRAFCIRHVAANFALTFKGKDARRLLVNAVYAKTEVEFDYWFDILRSEDPVMCEWANQIEYSLWTQHRDEGRRFVHMTTNISECVDSIMKGVRNLPVCSLVK
ncbi:uncharacterized protein LOC107636456 [Arachis ipaensis]|uniref:uncharacterized protein LOC107636456 n=1 Tax=Arachis ipaensis TaxID=130454 RepID=UPI0007AFA398|nr:uncharacterized protein LOC107636456 [Arachis ipaensis]